MKSVDPETKLARLDAPSRQPEVRTFVIRLSSSNMQSGKFGFVKILDGNQDFDKVKKSWLVKILDDDQDLIKFTNQEKLVSQES